MVDCHRLTCTYMNSYLSYIQLICFRAIPASLFPPLPLPPLFTHLTVLEKLVATLYALASLKFDYLLSRPSSVPPLNSLLIFPVSLTSPLL